MMTAAKRVGVVTTTVLLALLPFASGTSFAQASPDEPAAIVVYPYVVVDAASGTDTLIQLTNTDLANLVELRCFYEDFTPQCAGGQPGESCVPVAPTNVADADHVTCSGICLRADDPECVGGQPGEICVGDPITCSGVCTPPQTRLPFRVRATARQPLAWHASSGLPALPLPSSQTGNIPGVGSGPFVGTLRCVAVTDDPDQPSPNNALVGQATIERSQGTPFSPSAYSDAAQYQAIGIKAMASGVNGDEFLNLGGPAAEYEACPGVALVDHFNDGATLSAGGTSTVVSTTLVLASCGAALSTTADTVAQFLVFNEFGQRFSSSRGIHGQLVTPLSGIDTPQHTRSIFWYAVNGTLAGQTSISGIESGGGLGGGLHIVAIESHRDSSVPDRVHSDAVNAHNAGQRQERDVLAFWPPRCTGDCNFDGNVSIDELILGVNMALGSAPVTACPPVDANNDSAATIDELLSAVNAALSGCPAPVAPPPLMVTPTPAPTPSGPPTGTGPDITYFGVATADARPLQPDSTDAMGRPVFSRPFGQGMTLIIEARAGQSGNVPGRCLTPEVCELPDLQMLVSRQLGDGNPAVCEQNGRSGGIPAVPDLDFTADPATVAALNDLGCRVFDTTGAACTRTPSGSHAFVNGVSTTQFCFPIAKAWAFPVGDTVVAVQLRDVAGNLGPVREMVVRVAE